MTALTLLGLEAAYKATEAEGATPHRTPDFKQLKRLVDPSEPLKGVMWFVEEHNTGYDGVLFRYQFFMQKKDGTGEISTWADLLPDLLAVQPKKVKPLVPAD